MYFFSNFINSIGVMFIGMIVVFIGLIILIGGTQLMSKIIANGFGDTFNAIISKITGKGDSKGSPSFKLPKVFNASKSPADEAVSPGEYVDDAQLIAVITAAILATESADSSDTTSTGTPVDLSSKRLVVRSVRRLGGAWGQAGRVEQTAAF